MSKVAKAAIGLMIATLLSKILGFGRELVLASVYGTSSTSDAFLIAMNIPTVIFLAVGTSLDTAFIPLYHDAKAEGGEEGGNRFTNNVLNAVVILCLVFTAIGLIFAPQIVKVFAAGFEGETFEKAVYFTKVTLYGLAFLGVSYIMMAYLQVKDKFTIAGFMPVPNNLIVIISIILSSIIDIRLLPYGALLGILSQIIYQYPFAKKYGFKYEFFVDFKDKYLKKMLWLVGPVLIGVAAEQMSNIVDKTIASTLVEGSISALNYATKLNSFVKGLFIVSISSVIYPMLSRLSTENNKEEFNKSIKTSVNTVTLLLIPISVGAMILAEPIVKLLFQRGAFDSAATAMTSKVLVFYSIGMIGFGLRDILGKVFYSLQDTKTPMSNAILTIILNIVLNLLFVRYTNMKVAGLAFATSISAIVTIILFFISLRKKIGPFGLGAIIGVIVKSLISSGIMAAITLLVYKGLASVLGVGSTVNEVLCLGIAVGIGGIVYAISITLFKVDEVSLIVNGVKKKLKRR